MKFEMKIKLNESQRVIRWYKMSKIIYLDINGINLTKNVSIL